MPICMTMPIIGRYPIADPIIGTTLYKMYVKLICINRYMLASNLSFVIPQFKAEQGSFLMNTQYFYWAANPFCRLFRDQTETGDAFIEVWENHTGVSVGGFCCLDTDIVISQPVVIRKRPNVEKGPDPKRKEIDTIDATIEEKKYGIITPYLVNNKHLNCNLHIR